MKWIKYGVYTLVGALLCGLTYQVIHLTIHVETLSGIVQFLHKDNIHDIDLTHQDNWKHIKEIDRELEKIDKELEQLYKKGKIK